MIPRRQTRVEDSWSWNQTSCHSQTRVSQRVQNEWRDALISGAITSHVRFATQNDVTEIPSVLTSISII